MKTLKNFLIVSLSVLLLACSGSGTYRGNWKATDQYGNKLDLEFGEHSFSITTDGETKEYEYSQNSVNISNSVETYGIKLDNGKSYQIHFPIANDESKGAILDANGMPLYIISRDDYIGYDDVFGF